MSYRRWLVEAEQGKAKYLSEHPEWDKLVKGTITNIMDDLESEYDLYAVKVEEVEHKSRDGFIPHTEGGWAGKGFQSVSQLTGSGNIPGGEKTAAAVEKVESYNRNLALEKMKEDAGSTLSNEEFEKTLDEKQQEELMDATHEMSMEDDLMFGVNAYFYNKGKGMMGDGEEKPSLYVDAFVNWESPYHRSGKNNEEVLFKEEFVIEDTNQLKSKLKDFSAKIKKSF